MGTEISCVFDTFDDAERAFIRMRRTLRGIRLLGIRPGGDPADQPGRGPAVHFAPAGLTGGWTASTGLYSPYPLANSTHGETHEPALRREVCLRVSAADDYAARRAVQFFTSIGARSIRRRDGSTWG